MLGERIGAGDAIVIVVSGQRHRQAEGELALDRLAPPVHWPYCKVRLRHGPDPVARDVLCTTFATARTHNPTPRERAVYRRMWGRRESPFHESAVQAIEQCAPQLRVVAIVGTIRLARPLGVLVQHGHGPHDLR